MRYLSTAGQAPPVDLATALLASLAPDGGLYLPERIEPLPADFLARLGGDGASAVARRASPSRCRARSSPRCPNAELARIVDEALDFPIPLVQVEARGREPVRVLELFHGPTLAFKDVGARFLARLLAWLLAGLGVKAATTARSPSSSPPPATPAAPSPRPSSASPAPGWRCSTPAARSPRSRSGSSPPSAATSRPSPSRAPSTTASGWSRPPSPTRCCGERLRLTSANSINFGRLLPQVFYYLHAAAQLPPGAPPPLFVVPSGNFGNLTAGLLAKRLGLPAAGFVAATNVNDVVPEYLATGRFRPRPSERDDLRAPWTWATRATSPASSTSTAATSRRSAATSSATASPTTRPARRSAESSPTTGYLLDPHTAVGWLALEAALEERGDPAVTPILLATAHPAKFREVIEPVIGREVPLPPASPPAWSGRAGRCPCRPTTRRCARSWPPGEKTRRDAASAFTPR